MTQPLSRELIDRVPELHRTLLDRTSDELTTAQIEDHVQSQLPLCSEHEVEALAELLGRHLHGLGPLDVILADSTITEIMVNGPGPVWVERHGKLHVTDVVLDASAIRLVIDRITARLGLRLDRLMPFVDARLVDGSRAHITVPPMAIDGPYLTIRRFPAEVFPLSAFGSTDVAAVVSDAVRSRRNIVVTGATGSGKTSLLNTLAGALPANERVVTIEDSAELRLPGAHVVRLESRPPNAEGVGEITMRTLVRNSLRMRPDRLIVGEVRGAEAFEMVQALGTGHAGSFTTCHANAPDDALDRLTSMVLMAGDGLTPGLARRLINAALDLVIHVERAGHRRIIAAVSRVDTDGLVPVVVDPRSTIAAAS